MKKLEQNPGQKWWLKGPASYKGYAIREHSAILVAIWALFLSLTYLIPSFALVKYYKLFVIIGLAGAIIHTITWIGAIPNILPFNTEKKQTKIIAAISLFIFWIILNGIIIFLYANYARY